jgi:hypothetical protein
MFLLRHPAPPAPNAVVVDEPLPAPSGIAGSAGAGQTPGAAVSTAPVGAETAARGSESTSMEADEPQQQQQQQQQEGQPPPPLPLASTYGVSLGAVGPSSLEVLMASLKAPLCARNAGSLESTLSVIETELHEVRKFTWELKSRLEGEFDKNWRWCSL